MYTYINHNIIKDSKNFQIAQIPVIENLLSKLW